MTAYTCLNFSAHADELDVLIEHAKDINKLNNPDAKKNATIIWLNEIRVWISNVFPESAPVDLAVMGIIYEKVLPADEFQPDPE